MATLRKINPIPAIFALFILGGCETLDLSGTITSETRVNERFTQSMEWNTTHPERVLVTDSNVYRIAFAADCHLGDTRNIRFLLDSVKAPRITALILAGDNTSGHREDYDTLKGILDAASAVNLHLIVGNHDLYFDGWSVFYDYFGSTVYTLTVRTPAASDLYIMMDNASGTIGSLQLEWLRQLLAEKRSSYRHCVAVLHCNYFRNRFTFSTNPVEEEIYALTDLFAEYNIEFVITGHDHEKYIEVFGPTTYVTLNAMVAGESETGWMEMQVGEGPLQYTFVSCPE